ncbi:hypothetical protein FO519_005971 [Halicephalobus sp. NKZ332]|nr:hypothetical protein FO519_005971 [Halicephalobus sp. NKZ332]
MIHNNFSVLFVSALLALAYAKPTNLIAVACERNPSLAMCGVSSEGNAADPNFRAADAPEDEDTRFMRSFPKVEFDELMVERYCSRHRDHYSHYCVGNGRVAVKLEAKLMKFCPSFENHCPDVVKNLKPAVPEPEVFRDQVAPLVVPPPLPSASHFGNMAFDSPILDSRSESVPERAPHSALSPELIKTCTPDCTASHCTVECKCAYSHPSVHQKCNPPADSAMAGVCQAWYNKCPMFKPVSY